MTSINDQAIHWAVELAYGEPTPESRAELEAWLAADTRHRGAFVRARAWVRATEDAVVEAHAAPAVPASHNDNGPEAPETVPAPQRRRVAGWSGRIGGGRLAIAASLVAMVAVGGSVLLPVRHGDVVATEQVVMLKDGSVATLRDGAKIEVALSDNIRRITLLSGEASFKVAKDRARPFVVRSGDIYAQATGTVYSVRRVGATGGTVRVAEGSVLVWPRDDRDQAVQLHAGGLVTLDPGSSLPAPASSRPRLPAPELAQISLDNVPVKAAVARFNRVNSRKIMVADPAIGEVKIIGLYKANDPEQFAQAVASIAGGKVEHNVDIIVIKMK